MRGVLQAFLLEGSLSALVSLRFVNPASQLPLPISSPQHEQLALSHSSARLPHMQAERARSLVSHDAHCVPLSLSLSLPPSSLSPLPSPLFFFLRLSRAHIGGILHPMLWGQQMQGMQLLRHHLPTSAAQPSPAAAATAAGSGASARSLPSQAAAGGSALPRARRLIVRLAHPAVGCARRGGHRRR